MATWFAQNSDTDIDAVNQWNSAANGSGSALTWASLGASDILVANGKTSIHIHAGVTVTCGKLTTRSTYGGSAGGGFTWDGAATITAELEAGSTDCVTTSGTGWTATIIAPSTYACTGGNVVWGAKAGLKIGALLTAVNVIGSVRGGSAAQGYGINHATNTPITVIGNVEATGVYCWGIVIGAPGTGTVTVNGNVVAANAAFGQGIYSVQNALITVNNGNIENAIGAEAIYGPVQFNPGASNYIKVPKSGGFHYFMSQPISGPAANSVLSGVSCGVDDSGNAVTGTYVDVNGGPLVGPGGLVS